ncbi:MAG: hypothetical protein Q9184_006426 [Pyrenodesmia sp. 2 TL-2023]
MPSVQEDIIRADMMGHPMRTALPHDGRPSTIPFPIDPSDSDPAAYAMPAHQEKIDLFPAVTSTAESTISSNPTAKDHEPEFRNPTAADFDPDTPAELNILYKEHREASAHHDSLRAQIDEIQGRMKDGGDQGHDSHWLEAISNELEHKFVDVANEKQRILETIRGKYGRKALGPIEGTNRQLVEAEEELRELSKELSKSTLVETSGQKTAEESDK